jgi:hypothetical protein
VLTSASLLRKAAPAHGKVQRQFGTAIAATADYQQFVVPFSSLKQEGWGDMATFDPTKVLAVQFKFAPSVAFDVSVDDVGLY